MFDNKNSLNLTSSSDSEAEEPRKAKENEKTNLHGEAGCSSISFTSDSDDSIKPSLCMRRETPQKENFLGQIDLITSDEDEEPKGRIVMKNKKPKKIRIIDLLTSDEDDNADPKSVSSKTNLTAENNHSHNQEEVTISNDKDILKLTDPKARKRKLPGKNTTAKKKKLDSVVKPKPKSKAKAKPSCSSTLESVDIPSWREYQLLANKSSISIDTAEQIIRLFLEGNTIPFIARYRKNVTGNMSPEALRDVKESYEEICFLKSKIASVVNTIQKAGKLDNNLQQSIMSTTTIEELEHIYAPYKPETKKSHAEKARELGLEEPARYLLENVMMVNLTNYINPEIEGLANEDEVKEGIVHIITSLISTNTELLTVLRELRWRTNFVIETKKSKTSGKTKAETKLKNNKPVDDTKFETYYDFKIPLKYIKPHQVLAINRGEAQKCLTVKVDIPTFLEQKFKDFCDNKWIKRSEYDVQRNSILQEAIKQAYTRRIVPLITREIRSEMKTKAEKASVEIFSTNLKQLLLEAPIKGKPIMGIDPGFKNGCKVALISATGSLLATTVIYPHYRDIDRGEHQLKAILTDHRCELIAIGNGTACRETETWIAGLTRNKYFAPLNVKYTIVNEDGASIYSCSPEAKKEFNDMDPNIISAVSLARRVQEPMAELVKVEPAHLGIGMYQLDIKKKQLSEALDEVVSECVSFVGVDLNTASQCLLRRVAGLSDKKATLIIDYRDKVGTFTSRKELLKVYGIGQRIFEQCAGFLRVGPATPEQAVEFYKRKNVTKLDATIIHPESYKVARELLAKYSLNEEDIGTDRFISVFQGYVAKINIDELATQLNSSKDTVQLIIDAFSKKLEYDLRLEAGSAPLFREGVTDISNLTEGTLLTGRIVNTTTFGAFVDIGVGTQGLVHISKYNGLNLMIGNRVEVKVVKIKTGKNGKRQLELEALRLL